MSKRKIKVVALTRGDRVVFTDRHGEGAGYLGAPTIIDGEPGWYIAVSEGSNKGFNTVLPASALRAERGW